MGWGKFNREALPQTEFICWCNVNEPRLLWLKTEPECALFGVHALATTSALISFPETVSVVKGYGIISDNGLLFYFLLFPNLWNIKRIVKRSNFFSSDFVGKNQACMDFTNYLELSDAEKFSFDGIPFSGDNLPAKTQTFFIKPLESASFLEST